MFRYCAAIAHSPQYETDHKESLAQDWPHIPIPRDRAEFEQAAQLGGHIAALLDPLSDATAALKLFLGKDSKTLGVVQRAGGGAIKQSELVLEYSYYGAATGRWDERPPAASEVVRPEWGEASGDLYLNESVFLANVPCEVWRYELGGYPVLKKWLGYRQANRRGNEPLSLNELDEFRAIVLRLATMLSLRPLLDSAYEKATADAWSLEELSLEH